MKFIGVDFGWSSGASGLCCLAWQGNALEIIDLTTILEIKEVLSWIDHQTGKNAPALIAIDAPTIINNPTGMRLADKLTHKHFGRYHAGCYPANLGLKFAPRTTGFSQSLLAKNFLHAPTIEPQQLGRYQIEVFPHPATINLFGLGRILKYKKGRLADRRQELNRLRVYITDWLPKLEPALSLAALDCIPEISSNQTGKELKAIEDQLDSLLCAYIAAYWWYWGITKNMVLGDLDTGFIVIPNPVKIFSQAGDC
jgi:predicted RNase H-like nuclease